VKPEARATRWGGKFNIDIVARPHDAGETLIVAADRRRTGVGT
jgi:hypothetical protein